jgi:hypothetical protein
LWFANALDRVQGFTLLRLDAAGGSAPGSLLGGLA